ARNENDARRRSEIDDADIAVRFEIAHARSKIDGRQRIALAALRNIGGSEITYDIDFRFFSERAPVADLPGSAGRFGRALRLVQNRMAVKADDVDRRSFEACGVEEFFDGDDMRIGEFAGGLADIGGAVTPLAGRFCGAMKD